MVIMSNTERKNRLMFETEENPRRQNTRILAEFVKSPSKTNPEWTTLMAL